MGALGADGRVGCNEQCCSELIESHIEINNIRSECGKHIPAPQQNVS